MNGTHQVVLPFGQDRVPGKGVATQTGLPDTVTPHKSSFQFSPVRDNELQGPGHYLILLRQRQAENRRRWWRTSRAAEI